MTEHNQGLAEPLVTFVILNWNQAQMTVECLESLYAQEYTNIRVILVDNGSTDDSCELIATKFPDIILIQNGSNLGYTMANNVGIRRALELGTDYVFLLNNDTVVDPRMLSLLVGVAESHPEIGITGPTMLYFDQPDIIWCAGNSIDWKNGETCLIHEGSHVDTVDRLAPHKVDYITSCAICVKRAVFEEVGFMDERFFIYYDETDWFARTRVAGWQTVYVPAARMWHKVSATMGESSPRTDYYMIRNRFLFLAKNLRGIRRIQALIRIGLWNSRVILAYTLKNSSDQRLLNRNAKLLGMVDALRGQWGQVTSAVEDFLRG